MFECWGSCICVLGVLYSCVGGHVFMCWGACINVLRVMYLCVGGHVFVCWGSCICVLEVLYSCVGGHPINRRTDNTMARRTRGSQEPVSFIWYKKNQLVLCKNYVQQL